PAADKSRRFAGELVELLSREGSDAEVYLLDERLTTVSAHRALHSSGRKGRTHRQVVDQVAAVMILQQALDIERSTGARAGELVTLVLVGATVGGVAGDRWLTSNVSVESEETDFPGPGRGEAVVEVASGDTGTDIARTLVDEGVIKTAPPFVTIFSNTPEASN